MNKPRNIPFGQMGTWEMLQVLVADEKPDYHSLDIIVSIAKDNYRLEKEAADWLRGKDSKDSFVIDFDEKKELIEKGENKLIEIA